jgi:hypothetical protein
MQRRIAYLVVALFTFSIGISAVWLCEFAQAKDGESRKLKENYILLAPPSTRERFTKTFIACGEHSSSQQYQASTGEYLFEEWMTHSSVKHAERVKQKWIKDAEEIVERVSRFDSKGKKTGEKVIAIFPANDKGIKWVGIIWTEKSLLRSIEAPSVQLALEFERIKYNQ